MPDSFDLLLVLGGVMLVAVVAVVLLLGRAYVNVEPGYALVVNRMDRIDVTFTAALVVPTLHRAEAIDIRTKALKIERRGKDAILCRDDIRADIAVTFYVRVNKTTEDIIKVAQSIGCARAGDPATLEELFAAKFSEGLESVAKQLDFEEMNARRQELKDEVLQVIGMDLNGFVLDDLAIDELDQTPIVQLDPNNILDAAGIRKIVERTTGEKMRRDEITHEAERQARTRKLEIEEMIIELERRKVDALGRFREATGRELDEEALKERLDEHLRERLRPVVQQVVAELEERQAAPGPTPPS